MGAPRGEHEMVGTGITPPRGGQSSRRGARPRRGGGDAATNATPLLRALIGGDLAASRKLRQAYSPEFTQLAAALRDRRVGAEAYAASAIVTATQAVERDPRGERIGAPWDACAFAAVALRTLLQDVEHRPILSLPAIGALPLAQGFALVMIDVENLETADLKGLARATDTEINEHYLAGGEALGLPELDQARCPMWRQVALLDAVVDPVERQERADHVERCNECRVHSVVKRRRQRLLTEGTNIAGWGDIGRAWSHRHRYV